MREGLDVYTDNSQQLASSLERQFDKTAAVYDRGVGPRQELAVNSNSKVKPFRPATRPSKASQRKRLRRVKTFRAGSMTNGLTPFDRNVFTRRGGNETGEQRLR
jgi:hypothetical protein